MHWNSFGDFLAMGGYGFYVWTSYLLAAFCFAVELWLLRRRRLNLRTGDEA